MPNWLTLTDVPLFVSHRRLFDRTTLPKALGPWALDSGGFTELSMLGGWRTTETEYIEAVERYSAEIGRPAWAAPMDWMCEPHIIERTGLSVAEHQARTVENFCRLRQAAPDLPFIPVLQGWDLTDYLNCVERYKRAGVDLWAEKTVGLGSVCRRQTTGAIETVVRTLANSGLKLHGFGVKTTGFGRYGSVLHSADSMAWSFRARNAGPQPTCTHKSCSSCLIFALRWRTKVLRMLHHQQMPLWEAV